MPPAPEYGHLGAMNSVARVVLASIVVPLSLPNSAGADQRLGQDVVPTFEAVHLTLDADRPDYTGSVRIELEVREPTGTIRLHSLGPRFDRLALRVGGGASPNGEKTRGKSDEIRLVHEVDETGLLTLKTEQPLARGPYALEIDFSNGIVSAVGNQFGVGRVPT